MAVIAPEHLPKRLLWRGDDLPADAGRVALPAAVENELDRIVATLDRDPLPLLLLRPEDFALDASRAFMREVRQQLDHGPGFAIVDLAGHIAEQVKAGLDPAQVARQVLAAIRADELYVFTHPEMRSGMDERFAAIQAAMDRATVR